MRNTTRANVSGWVALALPALLPVAAMAEPLVLQAQPDLVADSSAVPTVPSPAPQAPAENLLVEPKLATGKILVLPFQPVNPNDSTPWLGKSIQESMVADLTVAAPDRVIAADQTAGTLDAAVALGKQNGARYVIAGGFVTVDRELRVTGRVVDVETGKAVAGLKATGDPGQIFHMEDALALQVRAQVLGQQVGPMQPVPAEQPPANAQTPAPDAGNYANPTPTPQYYSSYASAPAPVIYGGDSSAYAYYPNTYLSGYDPYYYPAYPYYNPYYYCDYGYFGGCYPFGLGIGFFFGNGFHRHFDFDRGHDFHGGFRGNTVGAGRTSLGVGVSVNAAVRSSNFRGSLSVAPSFARSPARISSGVPFRSSAFYQGSSFGHSSSIGGFHAGGFSAHASFGGGGGFHGGGGIGHASGGGGHR